MGFLDRILRRDPPQNSPGAAEVAQFAAYQRAMPFFEGNKTDEASIRYMTENPRIPKDILTDNWGFDSQALSFGNLSPDEIESVIEDYEIDLLEQMNFNPEYKDNPELIRRCQRLESVVKNAVRKSRNGEFMKRMSATVNISESKQVFGEEKQKKKGGVSGFLGL